MVLRGSDSIILRRLTKVADWPKPFVTGFVSSQLEGFGPGPGSLTTTAGISIDWFRIGY